jgi:hypothetical protein
MTKIGRETMPMPFVPSNHRSHSQPLRLPPLCFGAWLEASDSMLTLSADELRDLTAKRRSDAQRRALDRMGLRYAVRPDKSLAVLRSHVEQVLGAVGATIRQREPELRL